jgi:peptidoglycan L-alanyl-D-glutamate endopeptidase CwlK
MASRSLSDLNPPTRKRAEAFAAACEVRGIDVLIYCTHRPDAEQDELYKIGRTLPGKIVTNARAGESWHNHRSAIAESVGLEWAGRWSGKLKETAHCQYRGGLTLAQVRAGAVIA